MSEMRRLLETAERNVRRGECSVRRVRVPRPLVDSLTRQLDEDGLSLNQLVELVIRAYVERHPAVLAVVDDERRRIGKAEPRRPVLSRREIDEIYAELGGGIIEEED